MGESSEHEKARVVFQDACIRWLEAGGDLEDIHAEVDHTAQWFEDEQEAILQG